jgi:hypothetical protein
MKRKRIELTPAQAKQLQDLLKQIETIPYRPSAGAIALRVDELESMGLEDEPEYVGISSSVRQYAITTLAFEMARAAGEEDQPTSFVTEHPGLLSRADELFIRFGLRPMSPGELTNQLSVADW